MPRKPPPAARGPRKPLPEAPARDAIAHEEAAPGGKVRMGPDRVEGCPRVSPNYCDRRARHSAKAPNAAMAETIAKMLMV
jgi:hypothetical protein